MRQPTNKALAVLGLLRELGPSTVNQVADAMRERTPCGACNGTRDGADSRWGCRRCYGSGRVPFRTAGDPADLVLVPIALLPDVQRRRPRQEGEGDQGRPGDARRSDDAEIEV